MSVAKTATILQTVRRNFISVLFPSLVGWAIYADWSRTKEYKANKAKLAAISGEQLH